MNCRYFLVLLFTLVTILIPTLNAAQPTASNTTSKNLIIKKILSLAINSSINPATLSYLQEGFKRADRESFEMVLIKLNTPGGLVSTTKDILTLIGSSDIPTAVWVTPEGASATSAGAIIASGAHFIFMSEGTNIGAATPIEMSGDIKEKDAKSKAVNDLIALVQSLSESRGRNGQLFGEMVEKASSFKAHQAIEKNLINAIVNSEKDISKHLQGQKIIIKGITHNIYADDATSFVPYEMDLGQKILDMFANPSMAYILFLIGAALIYLEMQAPGGFIAGSIGAIFLVLAGIGFQILQLNIGALGLIVLSFVMFILEIYVTSYGILALAGLAALTFGSLFLFRSDNTYLELSRSLIFSSVASVAFFLLLIGFFVAKDIIGKKKKNKGEFFSLAGQKAIIVSNLATTDNMHHYLVKISGEIWKAQSDIKYNIGDSCEVIAHDKDKLVLTIGTNT